MNVENTKKQMRKGVLELCILAIISEEETYSTDIIKKLQTTELIVKEGTLYPLLSRLKTAGLLHYNWRESNDSPPRKYYYVTEKGTLFLNELWGTWQNLVSSVNQATQRYRDDNLHEKLLEAPEVKVLSKKNENEKNQLE